MAAITDHRAETIVGIACSDLRDGEIAVDILGLCQRSIRIKCLLLNSYGISLELNRDTRFSLAAQADGFGRDLGRLECRRLRG